MSFLSVLGPSFYFRTLNLLKTCSKCCAESVSVAIGVLMEHFSLHMDYVGSFVNMRY